MRLGGIALPIDDTIAAISTPIGRGGIGIVRVSGPLAKNIAEKAFVSKSGKEPGHFQLRYGQVMDGGNVLDEALLSFMEGPHSYTAQDMVEFSCHGGFASVRSILELVVRLGARLAEPGEFTKRAYLNGRIDLSQAEAVLELIDAKTKHAQLGASGRLSGSLSRKVKSSRDRILGLQARIEVSLDFPEYDDEAVSSEDILEACLDVRKDLGSLIESFDRGRLLDEGLKVAIAGRPNVGKSSLLNALVNEDRAIVADLPGTTRDVLSEFIHLGGMPLKIMDTAGIRQSRDAVELLGVGKSMQAVRDADLVLYVVDSSMGITDDDRRVWELVKAKPALGAANKSDLDVKPGFLEACAEIGIRFISMNAKDGEGLGELKDAIQEMFFTGGIEAGADEVFVNIRQKAGLDKALKSVDAAVAGARANVSPDLISIDLADAYKSLGLIIGEEASDDLVDKIFADFCVGK
jgi:tRNA modification GTPase